MFIINHRWIFFTLSALAVLASIVAIGVFGLRLGMDFRGGSIMEVEYQESVPSISAVNEALSPLNLGATTITPTDNQGLIIRLNHLDESVHQTILDKLAELGEFTENRFSTVGPALGAELARKGIIALILVIILIIVYIAIVFRQRSAHHQGGVSSWKYGLIAVVALAHDVIIPTGIFAVLGHFRGVEIDALFLTALLTVLGISVNDTIVIFDRIRENLRQPHSLSFAAIAGQSLRQTFTRSINTSLTVIFVLLALFFWGGDSTKYFALALTIGMIVGTYSSIFLATPLLVAWSNSRTKS